MIILFEKFSYSLKYLKRVLPTEKNGRFKGLPSGFVGKNGVLDGVGYLYNDSDDSDKISPSNRIVFVLPKVFLDETGKKAFGQVIPGGSEDEVDKDFQLNVPEDRYPKDFLANLSLWVCSSISQYRHSNPDDKFVVSPNAVNFRNNKLAPTLIDVMNAMKRFYDDNQNLIVFTAKNKHCGNNRIDWHRTITHTQPFIQNGVPIYMNLENKKKVFDLDDRLLVLYFSAMNYIESFGFKMPKSEFYTPMHVNEFRRLLGHRGLIELRRIKHKYFADKFLKLYNIMKAFFEWGGNFSANNFGNEYLLTSKYNNVFEAMIDTLLSDDLPKQMKYLKSQKDNKIVDHLYKDRQLVFADESQKIWFIGDSKYYKDGNKIEGSSIYKQYTYAKNIIQYNINDLLDFNDNEKKYKGLRYRDKITEGYSITPNFFIRGFIPSFDKNAGVKQFREPYFRKENTHDLIINDDEDLDNPAEYLIVDDEGNPINPQKNKTTLWDLRNSHFINRLFDRDTLLLQTYNINFLYVLKAYTSKSSSLRNKFKHEARDRFRQNFINFLDQKYVFYAIWPKTKDNEGKEINDPEKTFVDRHFRVLVGKIFKPEGLRCLILALENISDETEVYAEKEELRKMKVMWAEIKGDCEWFHVSPKEIFPSVSLLKPAEFDKKDWYFDKEKFGIFVKRGAFKKANIGVQHQLPSKIGNHKLNGSILGDIDLVRMAKNKSRLDKYYFLPCK